MCGYEGGELMMLLLLSFTFENSSSMSVDRSNSHIRVYDLQSLIDCRAGMGIFGRDGKRITERRVVHRSNLKRIIANM